jgi:hypothetical protein
MKTRIVSSKMTEWNKFAGNALVPSYFGEIKP